MPSFRPERQPPAATKSRLSDSLLRLHQSMEASKQHDHQMQRLFRTWQDRWASQSDELEQRLEYIDEQLSKLSDDEDVATIPHLSIVR